MIGLDVLSEVAEEFGFTVRDWDSMSLKIANKYHPKLNSKIKKVGRPKEWDILAICLCFDIQEYKKKKPKATSSEVYLYLSKKKHWQGYSQKKLENSYYKYVVKLGYQKLIEEIGLEEFEEKFRPLASLKTRKKGIKFFTEMRSKGLSGLEEGLEFK